MIGLRKRALSLVLVLVLAAPALTSCSETQPEAQQQTVVSPAAEEVKPLKVDTIFMADGTHLTVVILYF